MSPDRSTRLARRIVFRQSLVRNVWVALFATLIMSLAILGVSESSGVPSRAFLPSLHIGLVAGWALAAIGAFVASRYRVRLARHAVGASAPATISALDGASPTTEAWKESVVRTVIAAALMGPLSLHAVVVFVLSHSDGGEFWGWAALSLVLVTHVHVIGAVSMLRSFREVLGGNAPPSLFARYARTVGITSAASLIPGVVLMGIPPLLVLITGAVLYGGLYAWLAFRIKVESTWLKEDGVFS